MNLLKVTSIHQQLFSSKHLPTPINYRGNATKKDMQVVPFEDVLKMVLKGN